MYQSGKGYKAISKVLGPQRITVRAIIHKWRKLGTEVNLPRSGRPTKITPRAQWRLIQEVMKEPRTTSKELQASLASIKASFHDSTIRKRLGKNGIHDRVPKQKPLLTKKNTKAHPQRCERLIAVVAARVAHPVIRFRGQLLFHVVPGRFGQIFFLSKWNHYFKIKFSTYSGFISVLYKNVFDDLNLLNVTYI